MSASLVGSEMCIRDRSFSARLEQHGGGSPREPHDGGTRGGTTALRDLEAVSYTHLTLPTICSV
eukprot:11387837-Alexandrium_andersonii.AAC.1